MNAGSDCRSDRALRTHTVADGRVPALHLTAGGLSVEVSPDEGGRIMSLTSEDPHHEWLLQDLSAPTRPGDDFVRPGMGGWDECLPTIAATVLEDGTRLADHGEVWSRPWRVLSADHDAIDLAVSVDVPAMVLRRRLSAARDGLRIEYRLRSRADHDLPVLWCAHPQFDASGLELRLGSGTSGPPALVDEGGAGLPWPGVRVTDLPRGSGVKGFADPGRSVREVDLLHDSGAGLRMSWSGEVLGELGLWWDNGLCARSPVLGVEPATGRGDDVAMAARAGRVVTIVPGEEIHWRIDLRLL